MYSGISRLFSRSGYAPWAIDFICNNLKQQDKRLDLKTLTEGNEEWLGTTIKKHKQ